MNWELRFSYGVWVFPRPISCNWVSTFAPHMYVHKVISVWKSTHGCNASWWFCLALTQCAWKLTSIRLYMVYYFIYLQEIQTLLFNREKKKKSSYTAHISYFYLIKWWKHTCFLLNRRKLNFLLDFPFPSMYHFLVKQSTVSSSMESQTNKCGLSAGANPPNTFDIVGKSLGRVEWLP